MIYNIDIVQLIILYTTFSTWIYLVKSKLLFLYYIVTVIKTVAN